MITINSMLIMIFISACFTLIITYLLKVIKDKDVCIENLHKRNTSTLASNFEYYNDLNDILNAYDSFKKEFNNIKNDEEKAHNEYKLMKDFINFIKHKNASFKID